MFHFYPLLLWWCLFSGLNKANSLLGREEEKSHEIPREIHIAFIPNKWNRGSALTLLQYASIRSAYLRWNRPRINFWHTALPTSETPYFDLLKPVLTLRNVQLSPAMLLCLNYGGIEKVEKWIGLAAVNEVGGLLMDTDVIWLKPPPSNWFSSTVVLGNEADVVAITDELPKPSLSTSFLLARPHTAFLKALLKEYEGRCQHVAYNHLNVGLPSLLWFQHSEQILVLPKIRLYQPDWNNLAPVFDELHPHAPFDSPNRIVYRAWDNAYELYLRASTVPEIYWKASWFHSLIQPLLLPLYWPVLQRAGLTGLSDWPRACPAQPCLDDDIFTPHRPFCKQRPKNRRSVQRRRGKKENRVAVIKQRYLPGHGQFGFFNEASNVCIGVWFDYHSLKLKENIYVPRPTGLNELKESLIMQDRLINHYGHNTKFGFWLKDYVIVDPIPDFCYLRGTTVIFENSWGWTGHIGHYAENVWKLFSISPGAIRNIDRFWLINRIGPANDWEAKSLKIALADQNVEMKDEADLRRLVFDERRGCGQAQDLVCFEHAVFPQLVQRWFMSELNVDEMRQRVDQHCGVIRKRRDRPVLAYIPRFDHRRILNAEAILRLGEELGFDIAPPITNLTDFCGQVHLFASLDVVFSKHGTQLTGMAFMNPYSVAMELNNPGLGHNGHRITEWKLSAYYARINYLEYAEAEVKHYYAQFQGDDYAKNADVEVPLQAAQRYLQYAREIWRDEEYRNRPCMRPRDPNEEMNWQMVHWENNEMLCLA